MARIGRYRDDSGGMNYDYDAPYERQDPAPAPAPTPELAKVEQYQPAPPSEDPGAPPGGGDAGPGAPRPPMPPPPSPTAAPTTSATPVSAGSFVRPGQNSTALAPFRSAPGAMMRRPTSAQQFGPGTPLAGGAAAAPSTFAAGGDPGAGGEQMSPEELLRLLQGGL